MDVRVLRGTQTVFSVIGNALTSTNPQGTPFSDEIDLNQLASGPYVLEIVATDKATNVSVSQQTRFIIE
jgi:hypothetical protein